MAKANEPGSEIVCYEIRNLLSISNRGVVDLSGYEISFDSLLRGKK